jgi:hypothetical protein
MNVSVLPHPEVFVLRIRATPLNHGVLVLGIRVVLGGEASYALKP